MKKIYLAGGCFWGLEKYLSEINGVLKTEVGYANGNMENPSYDYVCTGLTNFVEAVYIEYDENIVPLDFILSLFYEVIDPTLLNKQGNDEGTQYRTGIYYIDKNDLDIIEKSLLDLAKKYIKPIVIESLPLKNYYKAEEYHQKYLDKNPMGYCHIGKDKFLYAKNSYPK